MNLYQASIDEQGHALRLGNQQLDLPERMRAERSIGSYRGKEVVVGIRPEDLTDAAVAGEDGSRRRLEGTVDLVEALGAETLVHFDIDANPLQSTDARIGIGEEDETEGLGSGEIAEAMSAGVARVPPSSELRPDQKAVFLVDTERLHLFDPETGKTIE